MHRGHPLHPVDSLQGLQAPLYDLLHRNVKVKFSITCCLQDHTFSGCRSVPSMSLLQKLQKRHQLKIFFSRQGDAGESGRAGVQLPSIYVIESLRPPHRSDCTACLQTEVRFNHLALHSNLVFVYPSHGCSRHRCNCTVLWQISILKLS